MADAAHAAGTASALVGVGQVAVGGRAAPPAGRDRRPAPVG
jgi:hypothetical protein